MQREPFSEFLRDLWWQLNYKTMAGDRRSWRDSAYMIVAIILNRYTEMCWADLVCWAMLRERELPLWRDVWLLCRLGPARIGGLGDCYRPRCKEEAACGECYCGKFRTDHHRNRFGTQTVIPREDQPF